MFKNVNYHYLVTCWSCRDSYLNCEYHNLGVKPSPISNSSISFLRLSYQIPIKFVLEATQMSQVIVEVSRSLAQSGWLLCPSHRAEIGVLAASCLLEVLRRLSPSSFGLPGSCSGQGRTFLFPWWLLAGNTLSSRPLAPSFQSGNGVQIFLILRAL